MCQYLEDLHNSLYQYNIDIIKLWIGKIFIQSERQTNEL